MTIVILLLLNGSAHEFLHQFTGHVDTVDCKHNNHPDYKASFEQQHHHCIFLDLQAPDFVQPYNYFCIFNPIQHNSVFVVGSSHAFTREIKHTSLRGPPESA